MAMAALLSDTETARQAPRVILAEDNDSLRTLIATRARALGYDVCEASNPPGLIQAIVKACFDNDQPAVATVVVSALTSSRSALDALRMLREHPSCPGLVFVAAVHDREFRKEAVGLGAIAVLEKPLDPEALVSVLLEHIPPSRQP
jgi:CheY-like chemotaxis protein